MGSRFWLYRTITTTVVRSHTAKHHAHVDCSKSAQHLASPEVCHVCDKNMSKPGVGRDICHKAARQSAERSRGDFHHSCLTYRKHFRSEMPRMILGFTSSFDVGELSTWILSTETSGWLGEFFQYKTTQILGVKDEELQLRLKQECAIIARCELSLLRQCCCRCRRLLLLLWRWFFRCSYVIILIISQYHLLCLLRVRVGTIHNTDTVVTVVALGYC